MVSIIDATMDDQQLREALECEISRTAERAVRITGCKRTDFHTTLSDNELTGSAWVTVPDQIEHVGTHFRRQHPDAPPEYNNVVIWTEYAATMRYSG
jgi:hypothetical protein